METYNLAIITKKLYKSNNKFFTLQQLSDVLNIKKSSLFKIIQKLLAANILTKIEKNKYFLTDSQISDFALANYLYQPSYISLESALNFYGILSQFPYEITSITTKKPKEKIFENQIFTYRKLKKELYFGYQKIEDYLIAYPEKALLDQLYLYAKGLKSINLDEYKLDSLNVSRIRKYLKNYPLTKQFDKAVLLLNKYLS
ncbi:MAG: hypothetical protein PHH35_02445 [Candidatus Pacebacteria bacterium]|jgi:predicted transcriptional regulator of viral defense system|nr:hypothetical protein [Candidatus Paceibacterota bacterium]